MGISDSRDLTWTKKAVIGTVNWNLFCYMIQRWLLLCITGTTKWAYSLCKIVAVVVVVVVVEVKDSSCEIWGNLKYSKKGL